MLRGALPAEPTAGRIVRRGAAQPDRQARGRTVAGHGIGAKAGRLGGAVTRPGWIDGGQLGPERLDEIAFGAAHLRRFD
jgi:hypothetical protein